MLMKGRLNRKKQNDEIDPMSGVVNLADAMLVFACGLMVALVLNWNVDISKNMKQIDLSKSKDVSGTDEFEEKELQKTDQDNLYEKMGTVYKDPDSGKMYMITDE